jgi:hypothetical protein
MLNQKCDYEQHEMSECQTYACLGIDCLGLLESVFDVCIEGLTVSSVILLAYCDC